MSRIQRRRMIKGCGLNNTVINILPFESHAPSYPYCEPGTNLKNRLARGYKSINPFNSACREQYIDYKHCNSIADRNEVNRYWKIEFGRGLRLQTLTIKKRLRLRELLTH